jgi:hypothetical protein
MKRYASLSSEFGMRAIVGVVAAIAVLGLHGCVGTPPPAPAPTAAPDSTIGAAAVSTNPPAVTAAQPAQSPPPEAAAVVSKTIATTAALTPGGQSRYACVNGSAANETRVAIVLPAGSERVCSRFPAMGPCQYERNACRAKGGRVIRFDDVEITKDVEREYDKQVQRFRLNAG